MRNVLLPALAVLLSAACGCASTGGRTKVALIVDSCSTNGQIIVSRGMVNAVSMAGFLPVILPNLADTNHMDEMVARADALVVFGSIKGETDERYRFERYMVRKAAARGLPVVGVCNGIQQVNVAFGGTYARNEKVVERPLVHRQNVNWKWLYHEIDAKPGSLVAKYLGEGRVTVNSSHNYSLARVADGFEVTARAPDGVVEAIEHRTLPVVGFQFHPEYMAVRGDERALALLKAALEGESCQGGAEAQKGK